MALYHRRNAFKVVKQFDAFPKIPEPYQETSPSGGTVSIISGALMIWLLCLEISYFVDTHVHFHFSPDTDFDAKLTLHVDMTVAMPCTAIGADIIDSTGQSFLSFGRLEEEETWWALDDAQRAHFDAVRRVNSYLREEAHALQHLLWRSRFTSLYGDLPARKSESGVLPDACRLKGSLPLNKVAGNFHVTAGKTLPIARAHVHVAAFTFDRDFNFSHRIHRFSFGDPAPGILHPLEGDESVANDSNTLFQYFIEVVSTEVRTHFTKVDTYQYSVRDYARPIDHTKGSHGVPGIYFKYDTSALKVTVTEESEGFIQFLVRICATLGGVYVTTGIINKLFQLCCDLCCKRLRKTESTEPKVPAKLTSVADEGTGVNNCSLVK